MVTCTDNPFHRISRLGHKDNSKNSVQSIRSALSKKLNIRSYAKGEFILFSFVVRFRHNAKFILSSGAGCNLCPSERSKARGSKRV
jgi:hypothetical protein